MKYEEATEIQSRINQGEILQVMEERGMDVFESDRRNAVIREMHGDTPYCAPDVDPNTGVCDGGDAWPNCCTGHRFTEEIGSVIYDHEHHIGGPTGELCHWMIEVVSGDPEPSCREDTVKIIDCGAPLTRFVRNGSAGWECESGHNGWEYGSPECEAQMMEEEFNERYYG